MRFFSFLFVFVIISFSFKADSASSASLIIPGEQAGPVRMGFTTIEEARDTLGLTKPVVNNEYIGTHWETTNHCTQGRYYEYYLADSLKGISMKARCDSLHIVYEMRLTSPCKWKTADGFGIGSSFEAIKTKMGTPVIELDTSDVLDAHHGYSVWHHMSYPGIEFISFHEMNKPGGCCVDLIIVTSDKIIRPGAGVAYKALKRKRCPKRKPCTKC